jgi:hypothetical protein
MPIRILIIDMTALRKRRVPFPSFSSIFKVESVTQNIGGRMFDTTSPYMNLLIPERERQVQIAVFMTGFDSVTHGNDEYILLTSPDSIPGDYHRFYQLPNDTRTLDELIGVMQVAEEYSTFPYVSRSLG